MPKVSDAHRAARRDQILDAAMRVLAAKGLAGLTMGDVIAESGLSAGAVYTYFTGKDEIVEAVGGAKLDLVMGAFEDELAGSDVPDPAAVLAAALSRIRAESERVGIDLAIVIVQVMSEAMLRPDEVSPIKERLASLAAVWTEVVRRQQQAGAIDPTVDPGYAAHVLIALVPGFILQNRVIGPLDASQYADTVRKLLRTKSHA